MLSPKSYTERLQSLGLPSLEYRRLRADMIQTYKIFKNIDRIERIKVSKQYHTNVLTTRGHNFKIFKPHCKTNLRKSTFSIRVITPWNNLPGELVNANSVNSVKTILNKVWRNNPVKFSPECYRLEAGTMDKQKETNPRGSRLEMISRNR